MKCTTKIRLPVERNTLSNYVLSSDALQKILQQLKTIGKVVSIEWEHGDCIATLELVITEPLLFEGSSYQLITESDFNQNSGRNRALDLKHP